jgi:hypothetical protein
LTKRATKEQKQQQLKGTIGMPINKSYSELNSAASKS